MDTAAFHERCKRIFIEARALPDAERASCLDRACAGDPVLRAAVVALLGHDTPGAGTATLQEPLRVWAQDGHDLTAVRKAFDEAASTKGKPSAIVAHTVKGKGVSFMENNPKFHGTAPTADEVKLALQELQ